MIAFGKATSKDQCSASGASSASGISQELTTEDNKGVQVKMELKNVIQSRRAALGLDTLEGLSTGRQFSSIEQLTPEEEERRRLRKERNKIAASKCREKKRKRLSNLQKEAVGLEELNSNLQSEMDKLRHERDGLVQVLETHTCVTTSKTGNNSPVQAGI